MPVAAYFNAERLGQIFTMSSLRMSMPNLVMTTRLLCQTDYSITFFRLTMQYFCKCHAVARSCNCEFAAISCYISETVQSSTKVTIEYENEIQRNIWNGVISSDL